MFKFTHILFYEQIKDCAEESVKRGYLVSCLVEHRGNITEYQCHQYITKMTAIVFSDYRLICGFMEDCKADINFLKCGSIRPGEKVFRRQMRWISGGEGVSKGHKDHSLKEFRCYCETFMYSNLNSKAGKW